MEVISKNTIRRIVSNSIQEDIQLSNEMIVYLQIEVTNLLKEVIRRGLNVHSHKNSMRRELGIKEKKRLDKKDVEGVVQSIQIGGGDVL